VSSVKVVKASEAKVPTPVVPVILIVERTSVVAAVAVCAVPLSVIVTVVNEPVPPDIVADVTLAFVVNVAGAAVPDCVMFTVSKSAKVDKFTVMLSAILSDECVKTSVSIPDMVAETGKVYTALVASEIDSVSVPAPPTAPSKDPNFAAVSALN
jgi:hypothetical protein